MDSDSWSDRLASASRRYQLDFLSRSDNFLGFEEVEGEDEFREEYACPFCSDYFDIVSLCCHIDEDHPTETINGVCPVCAVKVSSDMVAHITLQHANMFKVTTRKRKSRRGGVQSMLSILKREFPDGNFQSLFEGSSRVVVPSSSSSIAADPLLSSFISPMADGLFISETSSAKKTSNQSLPERSVEKKSLSAEDHREKLKQSEFVQGVFCSMILDDDL
ncbi:protein DEHYDRATION-INDUCED 19 homolog 6 [Raphanus sativus]|uniref:Protein DEHYDRATION-INDUCED 19 homolog 6 n=1 Tax=Raphanus sativus TaxID=3726 RepID=A0A6J0JGP2_RAPSA|nr:protein DEHYDRATION-INDUCED 19 homolog 6 [Raphanus sativus]XP_056845196.1 protein DEHYDRATION-INDUCED 19 homolog 6 [Raphanus sativus]